MKNTLLAVCGTFLGMAALNNNALSQDTIPHIVNAAGGNFSNATAQLDFSVGEVSISSLSSANTLVTIGFLQPPFSNSLAIALLDFNASVTPAGQVDLSWHTTEEINNNHFDVERSADGVSFSTLLTMAGHETSSIGHTYTAVDPTPFPNITYYRLKQVDDDGAFTYSRTIAVTTGASNNFVVFPNPFVAGIKIKYAGTEPFAVKITSLDGTVISENVYSGTETSVDLSRLASGMYIVQLFNKQGKAVQSVKITKQ